MGAHSSIFGTFAMTHPITSKLYLNIEDIILNKNHEKKLANILAIKPKLPFKISEIGKITKILKVS